MGGLTDRGGGCPWKGLASYYDIEVDGRSNEAAAWHYPRPSPPAREGAFAGFRGPRADGPPDRPPAASQDHPGDVLDACHFREAPAHGRRPPSRP
jgi:hypothetical protein